MPAHTVLVVEDDPVIQRLLEVNFSLEGFDVLIADDGEQGLAAVAEHHPDIVVMDIMMPKLSGLEALGHLREDPATAGLPIILLSARAQHSDVQAGLDAGADGYVTKPFEPMDLVEQVRQVLGDRGVDTA